MSSSNRGTTLTSNLVNSSKRSLGTNAFEVGPLAYGSWRFTTSDVKAAQGILETALESGMNLIDTADVYGFDWGGTGFGRVEDLLGAVFQQAPELRDQMVLASKGGIVPPVPYDSSSKALRAACEASLRRLGVEQLDLYFVHRPDMYTHPAELASTLSALRSDGKIAEVGVSNHTPAQVAALQAHLEFPIAANQFEHSAIELSPLKDGTFDQAMQLDICPIVWSPLAGGRLTAESDIDVDLAGVLQQIAGREKVDISTVALAFVLAHPSRPVCIIGTQTPSRIVAATRALDVYLDRKDVYDIIQASQGASLP